MKYVVALQQLELAVSVLENKPSHNAALHNTPNLVKALYQGNYMLQQCSELEIWQLLGTYLSLGSFKG